MAGEEREPLVIASNKPLKDWQQFLVESVDDLEHAEELADSEIYCVAIAALCKDGNAITAYKDMAAQDKAYAATNILFDAFSQHMEDSFRDLYDMMIAEDEEDFEEESDE